LFTPPPCTLSRKDPIKNILDSIKSGDDVKVFSGFFGDKNKIPRNQLALTASITAVNEAPSTAETAEFSSC
jgi:preprotein translocase subunit YajC